ncbi:MAG: hypothetical protein AAFR96_08450 [Planctomycetota bacterium]
MSGSDGKVRICAYCGHDCTGQPRMKDRKGRYMHRACFEKRHPEHAPKPTNALDALMLDVDTTPSEPTTAPCVNCGMPKPVGQNVCTSCRYDEALGKVPKEPKAAKQKKKKAEPVGVGGSGTSAGEEEKHGLAPVAWVKSAALAGVAAVLCAGAWGGIVYFSGGWEFSIMALGVGFVVGCGAVMGVGSHAGFMSGLIAGVLTLASVFGGKFFATTLFIGEAIQAMGPVERSVFTEPFDPLDDWMTDEQALAYDVAHTCTRREHKRIQLDWPTPADPATADELDWFPQDVVERCRENWASMSPSEKSDAKYELMRDATLVHLAAEAAPAFSMRGVSADYPRGHTADTAYFAEDYPLEVQTAAEMRFSRMSPDDIMEYHNELLGPMSGSSSGTNMVLSVMLENEKPGSYDTIGNLSGGERSHMRGMRGWAAGLIFIGASFFVAWGIGCGGKN